LIVSSTVFLNFLGHAEIVVCVLALCFIVARRQWRDYWALGSFLALRAAASIVLTSLLANHGGHTAGVYKAYFYIYWVAYAIESVLALFILYGIYRIATVPLRGLQRLGLLVYRWVAAICLALALVPAFAPGQARTSFMVTSITQLQGLESIFTLCLLLFVCFAIRPMGLSYRSHIFGVSLGLGFLAAMNLLQTVWLLHAPQFHRHFNLANGISVCAALVVWAAYFAMREPARREVALSAASPFLRLDRMARGWFR
jgi:hypothetical protein